METNYEHEIFYVYLLQPCYELHNMKVRNGNALSTRVTSLNTCRNSVECYGKFFSFDINRREFETSFGCQSYDIIGPGGKITCCIF